MYGPSALTFHRIDGIFSNIEERVFVFLGLDLLICLNGRRDTFPINDKKFNKIISSTCIVATDTSGRPIACLLIDPDSGLTTYMSAIAGLPGNWSRAILKNFPTSSGRYGLEVKGSSANVDDNKLTDSLRPLFYRARELGRMIVASTIGNYEVSQHKMTALRKFIECGMLMLFDRGNLKVGMLIYARVTAATRATCAISPYSMHPYELNDGNILCLIEFIGSTECNEDALGFVRDVLLQEDNPLSLFYLDQSGRASQIVDNVNDLTTIDKWIRNSGSNI